MNARIARRAAGLLLALAAVTVALGGLNAPTRAGDKGAKERPEGKWTAISMTQRGKTAQEGVEGIVFDFKGDRLTLSFFGKAKEGSFKADASKSPRQFNMQLEGEPRAGLGIYKLEKDVLTLCFTTGAEERPTKFEGTGGNVLVVLKRGEVKLDPAKLKAAVEKVRLAAQRASSQNNLKQIALAMHSYHDTYKRLPAHAIYSQDGKPLLSWRVAILPYIEERALYQQFRLDEPWDSAHNKKLLAKMPNIYAPVLGKTKEAHATYYQVFTGPGTPFEGTKRMRLFDFRDGTSNTLMVVEAGEAVPWTKPSDLPYRADKDLPPLGGLFKEGFNIALADGSVRWIARPFDVPTFRLLITHSDGKEIDWNKLER